MNNLTKRDKEIVDIYLSILKKTKQLPTRNDMLAKGINNDIIRKHFTSLTNLQELITKNYPKEVEAVVGFNVMDTVKRHKPLQVKDGDRFIITTAVSGGKVNVKFLESIKQYCKLNKARLVILPIQDPAKRNTKGNFYLSNELKEEILITEDTKLNNNLFISAIQLSAKQINPLTGLKRIGQRNGSCIYASPKQFLDTVAVSNVKIPSVLITTGAITKADYNSDYYFSKRTAYIAHSDHVDGAIVVEIKDNRVFYFRQIQADKSGGFVDLGKYYDGVKVIAMKPEAFVPGDWHTGDTDYGVVKNWYEVSKATKCDRWIIHDLYNGKAVNHHEKKKCSLQARNAEKGLLNMKEEFKKVANDLTSMVNNGIKNIVIVKSNHDDWLNQWLESGNYVNDPYNLIVSLVLAEAQIKGLDPLKYAVEKIGGLSPAIAKKIRWLNRDEDYVIAKIECGAHGDKGANGTKGTPFSMENAYGNCVVGHTHSAKILRGVWYVGTTTYLKLGYNQGASGWTNTGCLIYPNGARQMVFSIYNEWRIK